MTEPSRDATSLRRWLTRLGLVVVAVVGALALLEVAVRIFWNDPDAGEVERLSDGREMIVRPSAIPELDYELTPNAQGFAWGANIRINSHGQRGPEVPLDKGERYRVAVVGDSIAFGNRLPEELVFPYRLAGLLEDEKAGGYDVLNFAVGGYDVVQELVTVEERVVQFAPDLVVLAMCLNDAGVMSVNREYLARVQAHWRSPLFDSHLYRLLTSVQGQKELEEATVRANDPEVFRARYGAFIDPIGADETALRGLMESVPEGGMIQWYRDEDRIGRIRHCWGRLADLAKQHGFEVLVVVIPWLVWEDGADYPFPMVHEILRMEADRVGFPVLDVTDQFTAFTVASLRVMAGDPAHPNQVGHRILAERLRDYVLSR